MSAKQPGHDVVPEWLVERLAAGELPPERAADVRRRLEREPGGAARLAAIAASNDTILAEHPPAAVAPEIQHRLAGAKATERARANQSRRGILFGAPFALAAAIVAVVWLRPPPPIVDDPGQGFKGPAQLMVYRRAGKHFEQLQDGAVARAGDQLQLYYNAAGNQYGAVLSIDGAGHITFHLADGDHAARLQAGGPVMLPDSYELDAAPSFERFLIVASKGPFETARLVDVIRGAADAPPNTFTKTITLRKE